MDRKKTSASARALQERISEHREWLIESSDRESEELQLLRADLADDDSSLDNISDSLGILATFYGIRGLTFVVDGVADGWLDVSRSLDYRYWWARLRATTFTSGYSMRHIAKGVPNLTNYVAGAASLLCAGIVLHRKDLCDDSYELLRTADSIPGAVDPEYWRSRIFEPFAMRLYGRLRGTRIEEMGRRDLGVYGGIEERWSDVEGLTAVLNDVSDYHCSSIQESSTKEDPEFKHVPFDLLPFEILAVAVARKDLGLETVLPTHPLLELSTLDVGRISRIQDPLLTHVERRLGRQ